MLPILWIATGVALVLTGLSVERALRAWRRSQAATRERWFVYREMAARNAEEWRVR